MYCYKDASKYVFENNFVTCPCQFRSLLYLLPGLLFPVVIDYFFILTVATFQNVHIGLLEHFC